MSVTGIVRLVLHDDEAVVQFGELLGVRLECYGRGKAYTHSLTRGPSDAVAVPDAAFPVLRHEDAPPFAVKLPRDAFEDGICAHVGHFDAHDRTASLEANLHFYVA